MFVVFEGIDGSGKTNQIERVENELLIAGKKVYSTFEPTNSDIGTLLRKYLNGEKSISEHAISALFAADRYEHTKIINSKLKANDFVLCDRYHFSSLAYRGNSLDYMLLSHELLIPDISIILDINVDECLSRIRLRGEQKQIYENREELERIRKNYLTISKEYATYIVDGSGSRQDVTNRIMGIIT